MESKQEMSEEEAADQARERGMIADLLYPCGQGHLVEEEAMAEDLFRCGLAAEGERKSGGGKRKRRCKKKVLKPGKDGMHKCFLCDKDYVYKGHLRRHLTIVHHLCYPVQQIKCNFCGATFTCEETFEDHKVGSEEEIKNFFHNYDVSEIKQRDLLDLWREYTSEKKRGDKDEEKREEAAVSGKEDILIA